MRHLLYRMLLLFWLVGCSAHTPLPTLMPTAVPILTDPALANHNPLTPPPTPLLTPLATHTAVPTNTPMASPTPVRMSVTADSTVPSDIIQTAQQVVEAYKDQLAWVEHGQADVVLQTGAGDLWAEWVYAVAAPFATIADEVTLVNVQAAWAGSVASGQLVVDEETAGVFSAVWGPPQRVQIVPLDKLTETLWAERPSLTLIPFHQLTPDLKVLRLDGASPLDVGFLPTSYPLTIRIGIVGADSAVSQFLTIIRSNGFSRSTTEVVTTNYDPTHLTRVAMTGVTALVRATAYQMELDGVFYPGEEVAMAMQTADIAHVSNEVAFAPDCPYPNPVGGTTFCSRESYFPLLQQIGVDVVELTGNHVNDWGRNNLIYTLDLYDEAGLVYFGGGRNLADATEPAVFEHNGNRIVFVGCNPVGPANAWATTDGAGSRPCDDGFYDQIDQRHQEGDVVIATLQYYEDYRYDAPHPQVADFQKVAAAGATAVSGSQGHHVQGFAFFNGSFIHYGLGNLFFDQMDQLGTRQMFVDTYVIYNGRLLSVQLWSGLIENWARPRLMTPAERAQLLTTVFQASGW